MTKRSPITLDLQAQQGSPQGHPRRTKDIVINAVMSLGSSAIGTPLDPSPTARHRPRAASSYLLPVACRDYA